MPLTDWRGDRGLEEMLFDEPHGFEFLQAVRLLELRAKYQAGPDEEASEPVRFRASFGLNFPSSEIQALDRPLFESDPPDMTVGFFGTGGVDGPLPTSFSEEILARLSRQDTAVTAFLDIFHHRLMWLLYSIHKVSRSALVTTTPEDTPSARYIFSLIGLGLDSVSTQLRAPATLLQFAGLLAARERSAEGLRVLLADYFDVGVEVHQFAGEWCPLEPDQVTRIGTAGKNNALGLGALMGTRVWIQDAGISLRIGPLSRARFADFLPGGSAYAALAEVTRFYAGPNVHVTVELVLAGSEESNARLGTSRVGWNAWLRTSPQTSEDGQVRLRLQHATDGARETA